MLLFIRCHVQLFATPWTVACQAPLSTGFSGQEYWSELPFPSPRDLPGAGIEPVSPASAGRFFATEPYFREAHASPDLLLNQFFEAAPAHLWRSCVNEEDSHWISVPKEEGPSVLIAINVLLPWMKNYCYSLLIFLLSNSIFIQ